MKIRSISNFLILTLFLSACSSITYVKVTDRRFIADAPSNKITVHCSPEDKVDKNSFTYLYLHGKERIDEFIFRRPWSYETCLWRKSELQKVLRENQFVRIIGMEGNKIKELSFDPDDKGYTPNLKGVKEGFSWLFVTINGPKSCHSYFENDCNLKNLHEKYGP